MAFVQHRTPHQISEAEMAANTAFAKLQDRTAHRVSRQERRRIEVAWKQEAADKALDNGYPTNFWSGIRDLFECWLYGS